MNACHLTGSILDMRLDIILSLQTFGCRTILKKNVMKLLNLVLA